MHPEGTVGRTRRQVLTVTGANVVPYSANAWVDALTQVIQAEGPESLGIRRKSTYA